VAPRELDPTLADNRSQPDASRRWSRGDRFNRRRLGTRARFSVPGKRKIKTAARDRVVVVVQLRRNSRRRLDMKLRPGLLDVAYATKQPFSLLFPYLSLSLSRFCVLLIPLASKRVHLSVAGQKCERADRTYGHLSQIALQKWTLLCVPHTRGSILGRLFIRRDE